MNCWICGKRATRTRIIKKHGDVLEEERPSRKYRCYCESCLAEIDRKEKEERQLYIKLKKREMFRKACSVLENQNTDMYDYKEAIEVVEEYIEKNPDKVDSSYEVLTAIVLVKNRIYSKMQYKVGRYQVDFLLPEHLIVLEIDGDRHKHRKYYDSVRDEEIKKILGPHWEIIRIDTDNLDNDAKKIPKAIQKVLEYRETKHINWRTI